MSLVCGSLFSSFMAFIVYIVWSGDYELSFRFTVLLLCVIYWFFTVISKPFMSGVIIDEPGFTAPAGYAPPPSDSSADPPPESRKKCVSCPRRMSAKTADRHTVCVHCRGFDCNFDTRCEECIDWPEEELRLYTKMRKSLKTKNSSKLRLLRLLLRPRLYPLRSLTRYPLCNVRLIPLMLWLTPCQRHFCLDWMPFRLP